jgi:prophage tail gpP-like protein
MFVNGTIYTGWVSVRISRSISAVAGSFELVVANNWTSKKKGWIISPLDECVIKIDGEPVITGYVDKISSSFDGSSRSITISGRDKTADLVDCSYVGPASLDRITLFTLIQTVIKPFGLTFMSEVLLGTKVEDFKAQQGETAFAFLERIMRLRGLLLSSDVHGNLVVSQIGLKRATSAIHEGFNALSCSFDLDATNRFSEYIVKGQSAGSEEWEPQQTNEVQEKYTDPEVKRYRPTIIVAEGSVDPSLAGDRAEWEGINRAAKSSSLKVKIRGWKKEDGTLWVPNEIVNFESEYFGFKLDLLISAITYSQSSDGGTESELTLERKDAYQKVNSKIPSKSRDIWKELSP